MIFVPYNNDSLVMYNNLLHELGHACDPKFSSQNWKGTTEKYQKNTNPTTDDALTAYAKEPVEFDAMGAHFAAITKANFYRANKESRQKIIDGLLNWLKIPTNIQQIL